MAIWMTWKVLGFWMASVSDFDFGRVCFVAMSFVVACIGGYFGQPFIHNNDLAIGVIVNVFSVLSGFLVTVMVLLGEPTLFTGLGRMEVASRRKNFYQGLARQKWLFILYMMVLGVLFSSTLLSKGGGPGVVAWLERVYLSLAVFAFILSLMLPHRLMSLQQARFDELVRAAPIRRA